MLPLQADVSCESEVQAAFRRVDEAWGGPDILIANAGISLRHRFEEITLDEWNAVLGVNLTGAFLTSREAVRRMQVQGQGRVY